MAVPGRRTAAPSGAPPGLAQTELFAVDAYRRDFDTAVVEVDPGQRRVALARTAFYPGGGGPPHDVGELNWGDGRAPVLKVKREAGRIWHWLDADALPPVGAEVLGELDWPRRHLTMRTHTALHVLCGVIWTEFAVGVSGGSMEPGKGRLDFPLPTMSADLGRRVERRVNEEIGRARQVLVDFLGREVARGDPALIRTAVHLVAREVDPLRVVDIVGLDKQADGGTHVANTADVGRVVVSGTESKGKGNKRIRIEIRDGEG